MLVLLHSRWYSTKWFVHLAHRKRDAEENSAGSREDCELCLSRPEVPHWENWSLLGEETAKYDHWLLNYCKLSNLVGDACLVLSFCNEYIKITGGYHSPTSCSLIFPFKFPNAIILWQGDKANTLYEEYSASLSSSIHWSSTFEENSTGLEVDKSCFPTILLLVHVSQVYLYRHLYKEKRCCQEGIQIKTS